LDFCSHLLGSELNHDLAVYVYCMKLPLVKQAKKDVLRVEDVTLHHLRVRVFQEIDENEEVKSKDDLKFKEVVLQPGLVLYKKIISFESQQRIIDECIRIGEGKVDGVGSFYDGTVSMKDGFYHPDHSDLLYTATPSLFNFFFTFSFLF